ncbi:Uncharacterized protein dnm_017750 [Desulfonema magnum]|uniref:Uncharacterized protein n=1 Tax=Desulfonema magnum TaxID=45655 RepID=A0A975BI25_9BACT|nr:Uncharacterized protein dnm_017750 [Desulfonema magnum]
MSYFAGEPVLMSFFIHRKFLLKNKLLYFTTRVKGLSMQ